MTDAELKHIFETTQTIATVGFSTSPEKPAYYVPGYLMEMGYRVIPVNPTAQKIMGEQAYPDLLAVPEKIDVVQIFRPAAEVPAIVAQAIQIGAQVVWMQEGIVNEAAAQQARDAGLAVVMDRCMMKTHQRLFNKK